MSGLPNETTPRPAERSDRGPWSAGSAVLGNGGRWTDVFALSPPGGGGGSDDGLVMIGGDGDGNSVVEATSKQAGETFVVRIDTLYTTVAELGRHEGIDLEDGYPPRP